MTSTRKRIPAGFTTPTMPPSRGPLSRENSSLFKLIYIFMAIHSEKALGTLGKPLFPTLA